MTINPQPEFDINTADEETLQSMFNLTPRQVRRVILFRPYSSRNDLRQRLWGFEPDILDQLASQLPEESGRTEGTAGASSRPVYESQPQFLPEVIGRTETPVEPAPPIPPKPKPEKPRVARPQRPNPPRPPLKAFTWITSLILLLIILVGAYFRFTGLNWDSNTHQHPDERFITMTADAIEPVSSLSEYFDTDNSSLNPLTEGSYTYGMLPLFVTRYIAEWIDMADYDSVVLLGRAMSGLFDLASILVLFLVGCQYYNRRVGLLAAGLAAAAVLPIQLSHYFAVDAFSTVFVVSSFWFAAQAIPFLEPGVLIRKGYHIQFALFGLMIGLAMACKINTAPLFAIIGVAGLAHLISVWRDPQVRRMELGAIIQGWIVAAVVTAVVFRIAQPYAFEGPSFLDVAFNQRWLDVIMEVTNQVAGNSEWPPNHHWTNRSQTTYAITNIIQWGMGIPLGISAFLAWGWAAWRTFKGEWRKHLLPVVWIGAYFFWQNMQFWRYMRYFIPIYPLLILMAAWAIIELFDRTAASRKVFFEQLRDRASRFKFNRAALPGATVLLAALIIVAGTYLWAFAFTRIYNRPLTRVAASEWIIQNFPGPMNVLVQDANGVSTYPTEININETLANGYTLTSDLNPDADSVLQSLSAQRIYLVGTDLRIRICRQSNGDDQISQGRLQLMAGDENGYQTVEMDNVTLEAGVTYYVQYSLRNSGEVSIEGITLNTKNSEDPGLSLDLSFTSQESSIQTGTLEITPETNTNINQFVIANFHQTFVATPTSLQISIATDSAGDNPLTSITWTGDFTSPDPMSFNDLAIDPVQLNGGEKYYVIFKVLSGGPLKLKGEQYALETSWDDALPLSIDDYNPLGGLYDPENLELYDTDTVEKREDMINILDSVNYLVIPSNRAYDSMPRLPLRYPLTTKYYQALFNCEGCDGDALESAAYDAEPGFISSLGFKLVASFTSDPNIGPLKFNDQYADESFTVYDHPKVMIFQKTTDYDSEAVRSLLESVDLSEVFYQSPKSYSRMTTGLKLPEDRLEAQTAGGTWSDMFNAYTLINTNQTVAVIFWYLLFFVMGWLAFPLLFTALNGLPDRGYPIARLVGLICITWLAWIMPSVKLATFTRLEIILCLFILAGAASWLSWRRRDEIKAFLKDHWRYILGIEILFLVLFLGDLAVRIADPDLWNPWTGGEKPMEFAFFNAILKSVYFPPEHPWFAGNYINYYYYGYVAAAIPTKLLGILPSIAFNLVVPTWFAMVGTGIFSVVANLISATRSKKVNENTVIEGTKASHFHWSWLKPRSWSVPAMAGLAAVTLMLLLGNLYQVRQFYQYLPEIGRPEVSDQMTSFIDKLGATVEGGIKVLKGEAELPGDNSRWYFAASRPILHDGEDTPIAEFPLFTFLFADVHPHLLDMPVLFAALAWMFSILLAGGIPKRWDERICLFLVGGLVFGFTRPAHTWDFPTLVGLAGLAIFTANWREKPVWSRDLIIRVAIQFIALVVPAMLLYAPFSQWFGTEYTSFELWKGARTPLADYLTVHGIFLFILITFLWLNSREWLYGLWKTFCSRVTGRKRTLMIVYIIFCICLIDFLLWIFDYQSLVLSVPLLIWTIVLLLRPNQPIHKVITVGLTAAGVGITILVEILVLKGDVGRMNMVFRYYLQAWAFFSVASAIALVDIFASWRSWKVAAGRFTWATALLILVLCGAAYPLTAISARVADRWPNITNPPLTLNGMAYMLGSADGSQPAIYDDEGHSLDLSLDYAGIRFLQDNVVGTPVIVEGISSEYKWSNRYSIYTGLPAVMGWNWHVRQHNSLLDGAVFDTRTNDVNEFYNTTDLEIAVRFLDKYNVGYVIVGQMERGRYSSEGISKFTDLVNQGTLSVVFTIGGDDGLVIYKTN